jgi:glycosyltransferase involved in cell wall biosynthesis
VPVIVHSPHGHNFYGYFGPLASRLVVILERFMAYFTTRMIVFTELEKKDLAAFRVARPQKIAVVNSGLDLERYRKTNIEAGKKKAELKAAPDALLVGMVGRLDPIKGPKYFVEAGRLILQKFPQVKFLVVGDGSLRNSLECQCKKLNILESFIFTGWREDIPELLSILDLLVLPSLNEAVGRILIEAAACGIPVVATRVGGVPEIVKDNETGILVPPRDALALARGISALLEDKGKRLAMAEAARRWVDDKFSAGVMVNKISNCYEELAKR